MDVLLTEGGHKFAIAITHWSVEILRSEWTKRTLKTMRNIETVIKK